MALRRAMATDSASSSAPSGLVWVWSMGKRSAVFSGPRASRRSASTVAMSTRGTCSEAASLGLVVAEAHVAFDAEVAVSIVDPDVADGDGEEDWRGFFRAGVGDVFADVPAVGVDGFGGLAGEGAGSEGFRESVLDGLVADAFVAGAGFGVVLRGGGAAVVVAHLDEDEVAGLHFGEDVGPAAFVVIAAGATAGHGAVGDVDFGGVEVVGEVVAPAEVGLVAGGGVADDEEGGESGVERGVVGDAGLLRGLRWGVGGLWGGGVLCEG